ncbi:MAG: DUF192 domain-containing protein [Phycisphaerales bacterium]
MTAARIGAGPRWGLRRQGDHDLFVHDLRLAVNFFTRLKGLQFRSSLPSRQALLLAPCSSVHTLFLRFPLDLVFLDQSGTAVGVYRNVAPWKLLVAPPRGSASFAVLETNPGEHSLVRGDRVELVALGGLASSPPQSLISFPVAPEC